MDDSAPFRKLHDAGYFILRGAARLAGAEGRDDSEAADRGGEHPEEVLHSSPGPSGRAIQLCDFAHRLHRIRRV